MCMRCILYLNSFPTVECFIVKNNCYVKVILYWVLIETNICIEEGRKLIKSSWAKLFSGVTLLNFVEVRLDENLAYLQEKL